jgi:hypothetical protein
VSGKIHSKTEFPPYLKDLFEQSVQDLSPEQGSKVKHLLQTFSHIFAKDDADFGRTSINKHEIEVQNARPVKEPPRRVPYPNIGRGHRTTLPMTFGSMNHRSLGEGRHL